MMPGLCLNGGDLLTIPFKIKRLINYYKKTNSKRQILQRKLVIFKLMYEYCLLMYPPPPPPQPSQGTKEKGRIIFSNFLRKEASKIFTIQKMVSKIICSKSSEFKPFTMFNYILTHSLDLGSITLWHPLSFTYLIYIKYIQDIFVECPFLTCN